MRFLRVVLIGFIVSVLTLIDDTVVFIPLFFSDHLRDFSAMLGIVVATLIQLTLIIAFAEKIQKFKYSKQISVIGLLIFATVIALGWI